MTTTDPWADFACRTIRPPARVYRRRRLGLIIILVIVTMIGLGIREGAITNDAPPATSPDIMEDRP